MTGSTHEIDAALSGIAEALRADGYELEVTDASAMLTLRITALDGACEDCLVPPDVMAMTVSGALRGRYEPDGIKLEYPRSSQ